MKGIDVVLGRNIDQNNVEHRELPDLPHFSIILSTQLVDKWIYREGLSRDTPNMILTRLKRT